MYELQLFLTLIITKLLWELIITDTSLLVLQRALADKAFSSKFENIVVREYPKVCVNLQTDVR